MRGVFPHKNSISGYASIAFLMIAAQLIAKDNYRHWLAILADCLLACLCIVCMVWSESASAIPVLLLAMPLLLVEIGRAHV